MINNIKEKLYSLSLSNKLLVFSIIVIVVVVFFAFYNRNSSRAEDKFVNYITDLGYRNEDGGNLYYKYVFDASLDEYESDVSSGIDSHYEVNYFDVDNFLFKKVLRDYKDKVNSRYNYTYDYKDRVVSYTYRVQDKEEATLIFSGEYKFKKNSFDFSCKKDYRYQYDVDSGDELVCSYLKGQVIKFYEEATNVIEDYSIVSKAIK